MNSGLWPAPVAHAPVRAVVSVPGSKSESNRALLLAALADGPSTIDGLLDARDTRLMRAGLAALGGSIEDAGRDRVLVTPGPLRAAPGGIDCGLAGTVMRFLPAVAVLAPGVTRFTGDAAASQRPLAPLLDALRQLGAHVDADALPFRLRAPDVVGGPEVRVDASASSQFVSAVLLPAARYPHGVHVRHIGSGAVPSLPHIDMTLAMLRERGVDAERIRDDEFRVAPGPIAALDTHVEPDLTTAAVFLAAGVATGGSVRVDGWPTHSVQPGIRFADLLRRMGARVSQDPRGLTASGDGALRGIDVDLHEASELTPVVAALAVLAAGPSVIRGVAHIRGHETDRLAALETELRRCGADVRQTDDGLRINGGRALHGGGIFETYADHRMAHAAALLGLRTPGIDIADIACTSKTMPEFPLRWQQMLEGAG